MTKNKLNLGSLKQQANQIAANQEAIDFVQGASSKAITPQAESPEKKKERKLIVEGQLKNRSQTCIKPIQLYLRNEYAAWIQNHAVAGRGGLQIMINYLVRRGIEAVEKEYTSNGMVFADESQDGGSTVTGK